MIRRFRSLPIRRKVTVLVLASTLVVLLLASGALSWIQYLKIRADYRNELASVARIIAGNSAAAITFDDMAVARECLETLRAQQDVTSAVLYRLDGSVLTTYTASGHAPEASPVLGDIQPDGLRHLLEPVSNKGERAGTLYLRHDYEGRLGRDLGVWGALLLTAVASVAFAAWLISIGVDRWVVTPLIGITNSASRVADSKDFGIRVEVHGQDEIARLAEAFNSMLAEIARRDLALEHQRGQLASEVESLHREIGERQKAEAQLASSNEKLVRLSRQAGMAEIATAVLHNIGNVLNSLNVASELARERIATMNTEPIDRLVRLLANPDDDLSRLLATTPRGIALRDYLSGVGSHWRASQTATAEELEGIRRHVSHLRDIVSRQQSLAKGVYVNEEVDLSSVVSDAVALCSSWLSKSQIQVSQLLQPTPPVQTDRNQVLQILINLIRNAQSSLDEAAPPEKKLTLEIFPQEGRAAIRATDNGLGIARENLTRIFASGFTTKKDGHGFGLHSGANTARAMGGRLIAESAGLGFGASFTLELPLSPPTRHAHP